MNMWSIWFSVCWSGDIQMILCIRLREKSSAKSYQVVICTDISEKFSVLFCGSESMSSHYYLHIGITILPTLITTHNNFYAVFWCFADSLRQLLLEFKFIINTWFYVNLIIYFYIWTTLYALLQVWLLLRISKTCFQENKIIY